MLRAWLSFGQVCASHCCGDATTKMCCSPPLQVVVWPCRWPADLRQADLGGTAQCGDVHEAFLRLQEDADRGPPRRPWRPFSSRAAEGAGSLGRCGSSDSRGPTLRVTLRPMPRPRAGPDLLEATMQSTRWGRPACLHSGHALWRLHGVSVHDACSSPRDAGSGPRRLSAAQEP